MTAALSSQLLAIQPRRETGRLLVPARALLLLVFLSSTDAWAQPLQPVPDPTARRHLAGQGPDSQPSTPFTCHAPPAAVVDLSMQSAYRPDDPTQSEIEKSRQEEYTKRVEALRTFTRAVNRLADQYVLTRPRDGRIALCLASWLEQWASGEALLPTSITAQGNAERKWNLVAFSLSYTMTADAPELGRTRRRLIEAWLRRLAHAWISAPDYGRERPNNHLNWGGLALLATGIATQDRDLFERGLSIIREALKQVEADGSLPLEMARGARAIGYHGFALEPLVIAAELAKPNGVDLYTESEVRWSDSLSS
jgi:poly(beta-D-mannuronate) lyase